MVAGTLNGVAFTLPLEPDGRGGHWLQVDAAMQKAAKVQTGRTAVATLTPVKDWPEPKLPADWRAALKTAPDIAQLWRAITPMARWEWLRWIGSTANPATRAKRIGMAVSKLRNGERRPCCFNRNMCCVPAVSTGGVLLGPESGL